MLLIVALWAGSLWTTGFLVVPILFATLSDKVLAGTIAGSMFRAEAWLSMCCAIVLLVLSRMGSTCKAFRQDKFWSGLVLTMLACTLIGYFGLQPFMAALREAAVVEGGMHSEARRQFGLLHGISSGIYLLQSLLGAALVLRSR